MVVAGRVVVATSVDAELVAVDPVEVEVDVEAIADDPCDMTMAAVIANAVAPTPTMRERCRTRF